MPTDLKKAIRKFTDEGLKHFEAYIESGPMADKAPPIELLENDSFTTSLGLGEVTVKPFKHKFDMGMSLLTDLGPDIVKVNEPNVWPWLSLLFHESTFPKKGDSWFVGTSSRHIRAKVKDRRQDQAHRHLVLAAVFNVQRFGASARVLMEAPHQQGKIEENIMSRRQELPLAGSLEVIKALYKIYWDPSKGGRVRKGAKGEGPGGIIRFIALMRQLDATYDVISLSAERIIELLPKAEFGKFLDQ